MYPVCSWTNEIASIKVDLFRRDHSSQTKYQSNINTRVINNAPGNPSLLISNEDLLETLRGRKARRFFIIFFPLAYRVVEKDFRFFNCGKHLNPLISKNKSHCVCAHRYARSGGKKGKSSSQKNCFIASHVLPVTNTFKVQ